LGDFSILKDANKKFGEIADSFEYSHARTNIFRFESYGLLKFRKFDHLQEFLNEGIEVTKNVDNKAHLLTLYLVQVQLFLYEGKIKDAEEFLNKAELYLGEFKMIPVLYTHYLLTTNQLDLEIIKVQKAKGETSKNKIKEFRSTSKKLISKSRTFVPNLTQAYLLRSKFFISQKKYKKAFKNLQLAIQTGEKYNSRLELSRAYFECGKFLSDPKTKQKQLNGLSGKDYLEKSKVMFEEMDLQWDLEEWQKFVSGQVTP